MFWPKVIAQSWAELLGVLISGLIAGLIIPLIMLWRQSISQQKQSIKESIKTRQSRTLDIDAIIQSLSSQRDAIESAFPIGEWRDAPATIEQLDQTFRDAPQIRAQLKKVLGLFESLAILTYAKAIDENIAFELIGGSVIAYGRYFHGFIAREREALKNPRKYVYLTYMASDDSWLRKYDEDCEQLRNQQPPLLIREGLKEAPFLGT